MVFIDKGEANSAISTFTSMQKGAMDQTGKLLNELLEILRKIEKGEKLNEQEQKDLDKTCAEMVASAAKEYGTVMKGEDGKELTFYEAEKYAIVTDLDDLAGMPVYGVYSKDQQGMVMSFQFDPKTNEPVFFEVESPMSNEEKAGFVKALERQAKRDERREQPKGVELVKLRLEQMGGLAPQGSKAVVVADAILQQSDSNRVKGNLFEFQRAGNGAISVISLENKEVLAQMSPDGTVNANMGPETAKQFDQMLQKLQAGRSHSSPLKSAAKEMEIGGR